MFLATSTAQKWLETVLGAFDEFLLDHAACERKASATALSFVSHYPDRQELVSAMIELAREELHHFHQVYKQIAARGLQLAPDSKDLYVLRLQALIRKGREEYLMDRLLVAGIIEARGCERFTLLAGALSPGPLKELYATFSVSEAHHQELFFGLARAYFSENEVNDRVKVLVAAEAEIVQALPARPALH